jgi:hypothetical protein
MTVTIKSDGVLEAVAAKLAAAPDWLPAIYERHLPWAGAQMAETMEGILEKNRYTGALQGSISVRYDSAAQEVAIGPTAMRGSHDGGTLLEEGTGPIPNAPWAPIAAWADFKGLPAFPVWWKIRTVGVDAHPFLEPTLADPASQDALLETGKRIVTDAALEIVAVEGVGGISVEQ